MVPSGKASLDDLRRRFSKPRSHIFKDTTLPISFLSPHVIEHLISNNNKISDINIFLNKAIFGRFGNQLTLLLKYAVVSGKADLVRLLINRGGDVNHKDSNGRSLVSLAVEAGHLDVVNVLISSGWHVEVALLLIGRGAKANLKRLKGMCMWVTLESDGSKNHRCYQSL
ncbi:hypothetical protein V6N13_061259 [Hibiscus sabdariffa]|uniref:Ankyrin repeat protein n=1 Tax=Hibiscus sabdariffa TaxID=183260 RepID=A0ABR2EFW6_9ROSI